MRRMFLVGSLWILGIGLAIHTTAGFFYVLTPMEFWIDYKHVTPVKRSFTLTEDPLRFISSFQTHRPSNVRFQDTLFCDHGDGLGYIRQGQAQNKQYFLKRQEVIDSPFPFPNLAKESGECYLSTTVVLELPLDIERSKKFQSPNFIIGNFEKVR